MLNFISLASPIVVHNPNTVLEYATFCVPKRTPSQVSYFQKGEDWFMLKGDDVKSLNFKAGNAKAFQSGEQLIIFWHRNQPEILVFNVDKEPLHIPIQASGDFGFAEWNNSTLFLGGTTGKGFQILKVNTAGEITNKITFDAPKRQALYTNGRLFSVLELSTLWVYVPRSMELFELDLDLKLKNRSIIESMPHDLANFNASHMIGLRQLTEKPDIQLQEILDYCEINKNNYIRVECMGLVFRNNHLSLLYNCLVLKGYPKNHLSDDILRDLETSDINLELVLRKGKVIGANDLDQGFIKGMFGVNHFLYTNWDHETEKWRYGVFPWP